MLKLYCGELKSTCTHQRTLSFNALLQQHRFGDALTADEQALPLWGPEPALNQLHADILIELGRYDEAARVIARRLS